MSVFEAFLRRVSRLAIGVSMLFMTYIPNAFADLLVGGSAQIFRYDETTGEFLGVLLPASEGVGGILNQTVGPDGKLYLIGRSPLAGDSSTYVILRYDGKKLEVFVPPGRGGLGSPADLEFGPDGNLYVADSALNGTNSVLRFNGKNGKFMNAFASGGGMQQPNRIAFGPNGDLYVGTAVGPSDIFRYHGDTGLPYPAQGYSGATFVRAPTSASIFALTAAPDGTIFAAHSSSIYRYDGTTGALLQYVGSVNTTNMAFGPDGNLYILYYIGDSVRLYDSTTGKFLDTLLNPFIPSRSGGLRAPVSLTFACVPQHGPLKRNGCKNSGKNNDIENGNAGRSVLISPF